jgi:hypothetical protein
MLCPKRRRRAPAMDECRRRAPPNLDTLVVRLAARWKR